VNFKGKAAERGFLAEMSWRADSPILTVAGEQSLFCFCKVRGGFSVLCAGASSGIGLEVVRSSLCRSVLGHWFGSRLCCL